MPDRPLTPRVVLVLVTLAVLLAALTVHRLQCAGVPGPYVAFSGRTMGTTYEVKVARADLSPDEMREIGAAIEQTLERVNGLMSTWIEDSELSRFNALRSTEPFLIADETALVFSAALEVSAKSGGAFDVTVGPLVDAWGFGRGKPEDLPDDEQIAALKARVGWEKLALDRGRHTLAKSAPDVEANLSALAKGYGVDAVAAALEALGQTDYLVEIGGELRARGERIDGRPFRVAIEEPVFDDRRIHRVIDLRDTGMATSGDYRNWIEVDGVHLSHTLDPRTGRPITHDLASVTVLHPQAMWADAWATALNVLGPDEGFELARREDLAAYFIVRTGDGDFETRATPAFVPLLASGDAPDEAASN
jgi:thiamine biosynthesis lipoprotein